jgi:hypothetical protein
LTSRGRFMWRTVRLGEICSKMVAEDILWPGTGYILPWALVPGASVVMGSFDVFDNPTGACLAYCWANFKFGRFTVFTRRRSFPSRHSLPLVSPFLWRLATATNFVIYCFAQRLIYWFIFLSFFPVYPATQVLSPCFLVLALSLPSFCPWHWLSWPIPILQFRILDKSSMREALVRLDGPRTRLDSGRR